MKYSNENHINIIPQNDFQDLVQEVFSVIAENLSLSLGPLGSSATIFDGSIVEATKDGYSILKRYAFLNRYKRMIYNLIKAPCTKMNNTVGDGTTTAIVLTNLIYQAYQAKKAELEKYYRMPREFNKAWDTVIENIVNKVKEYAKPISPDDYDAIYHIAYVSSNGNEEISNNIATAYNEAKSPAIKLKDSPTNKSYLKAVDGFEFPANAIDPVFVQNEDLSAKYDDVVTMIFDHTVDANTYNSIIIPMNDVFTAMRKKFIVIAPKYDEKMLDDVVGRHINIQRQRSMDRSVNCILLQYRMGELTSFQKEDLATVLKSNVVNDYSAQKLIQLINSSSPDAAYEDSIMEDAEFRYFGNAKSIMFSMNNGSIFTIEDIEDDENYQNALAMAEQALKDILGQVDYEKQSYASKVHDARSRVLQLKMKNYIYYIGADSQLQKQIIYDAVEDVVKCVQSSTKNGIVPGCQLSIMRACRELRNQLFEENKSVSMTDPKGKLVALEINIIDILSIACNALYITVLNGPKNTGVSRVMKELAPNTEINDESLNTFAKEILMQSIQSQKVFDIESMKYTDDVVTSAETDTMVLTAASELIKILISGNQCVFCDPDVTGAHQDEVEVYA